MAYIYKITNNINNKIYIGKTEYNIHKRFQEHCTDCHKRRNEKRPLYAAMRKYGIEHFFIEMIEECENAAEREIYWIEFYDSYRKGYNATKGGDGKRYVDYDAICEAYQSGCNQSTIAKMMSIDVGTVHNVLKARNVDIKNIKEVMQAALGIAVNQYTKDGQFIRYFPSALDAARFLGKDKGNSNGPVSHITDVCKGKRKSAYGSVWAFA